MSDPVVCPICGARVTADGASSRRHYIMAHLTTKHPGLGDREKSLTADRALAEPVAVAITNRPGRPRFPAELIPRVVQLRDAGRTWGEIARELRIPRSTARTVYVNSRVRAGRE